MEPIGRKDLIEMGLKNKSKQMANKILFSEKLKPLN